MKWYYRLKLKRIRAEIDTLKKSMESPLMDNYTGHARLRSLTRLADRLQERLVDYPNSAPATQTQD
jgi:hypothetical protein